MNGEPRWFRMQELQNGEWVDINRVISGGRTREATDQFLAALCDLSGKVRRTTEEFFPQWPDEPVENADGSKFFDGPAGKED